MATSILYQIQKLTVQEYSLCSAATCLRHDAERLRGSQKYQVKSQN
jgi:hypothetical protein